MAQFLIYILRPIISGTDIHNSPTSLILSGVLYAIAKVLKLSWTRTAV